MRPYMIAATVSYILLVLGLVFRKKRKLHACLMGLGILTDLTIVMLLEINRDAVKTAVKFSLTTLQQLHVGTSACATALYFPVAVLGLLRLFGSGNSRVRHLHLRSGVAAFIFRSLGFIFMFSLLWKNP